MARAIVEAFKIELTTDPLVIGYAGMTDQQCLDSLKDPIYLREDRTVESRIVFVRLSNKACLDAANEQYLLHKRGGTVTLPNIVKAMTILNKVDYFDFNDNQSKTQLDTALQYFVDETTAPFNTIAAGWKTNLMDLGSTYISRAEVLGFGNNFGIGVIEEARA